MPSGKPVDAWKEGVPPRERSPTLEIVLSGRLFRFDEAAYAEAVPARRRSVDAALDRVMLSLCQETPIPAVLRAVAAIGGGWSLLRNRAALMLTWTLLSGDPGTLARSRLALLLIVLGLMDVRCGTESVFRRFLLALTGVRPDAGAQLGDPPDLLTFVLFRLLRNQQMRAVLTPATIALLIAHSRLARAEFNVAVPLAALRPADRPGYRDVSWHLLLRLGIFLRGAVDPENLVLMDLVRTVIADGVAAGFRDRSGRHRGILDRARRTSRGIAAIEHQVAFEDDPEGFRSRRRDLPQLFRRVRPPERTEVVLAGDGSEVFGYARSVTTGQVVGIERDELTAPLRGSRDRYRWNNEPVLRTRLAGAVVSPYGLVVLDDDAILDTEFANLPNRSGTAVDRYQLGAYPELVLTGDRSAVLNDFPRIEIADGALLSGLPNMENYGHFILNGTSKFPLLCDPREAGASVIVPCRRAPFHDAIIDYCGLDPARFVFSGGTHGIAAERLDVFSEAPMGKWPYNLLAALRAGLPRSPRGDGPRRIYLGRPDTARRALVNEDALTGLLAEFGFEAVCPEVLPFNEQVALLEGADVIVAPHGSALATLMFCHGAKRVVEVETKTSYRMTLYNFLNHQAIRVPSHVARPKPGISVERLAYAVDLDAARSAVAWAVGG